MLRYRYTIDLTDLLASLDLLKYCCLVGFIVQLMEIKLEKYEYIQQKLAKLKCSQGCQANANYIVYETGLLCTLCLSKLGDVPQSHLASLQDLAKTIADLAEHYEINSKKGHSLLPLKAEIDTSNKTIKSLRDSLTLDVKAIHEKTRQKLNSAQEDCLKNSRNQELESIFQPDLTASLLASQQQLLIANLKNLKVSENGPTTEYLFNQDQESCQKTKSECLSRCEHVGKAVTEAHQRLKQVMQNFRSQLNN